LGQPAVASALVITPKNAPPGPRPVVIWNHGTTGVARGCAPSLRDASATKWAIPGLDDALSRGWVVVASDYSGQGAPGVFPYLIGAGEAHSSLDAVLAAQELPDLNLSDDVVVWGHSQGGHAALWSAQLAAEYTPDLSILGTVAIAPVADPRALARELTRGGGSVGGAALSVMISWVLVPYADTYPDVNVTTYVAPGARSLVREMTHRCLSEPGVVVSMLTALGVSEDRPLYPADLTDGPLGRRLSENAAEGPFPSPVLVAWGSADEVIPTSLQSRFIDAQCEAGVDVHGIEYPGYNHLRTIMPGSRFLPVLMRWTAARFDGQPVPAADCG
jgi:acetyl esterase/lipase